MSYRTDMEPVYKPDFRTDIEGFHHGYVLVQRHIDSPHDLVWRSPKLPSVDAVRRYEFELQIAELLPDADEAALLHYVPGLTHIAFLIHQDRGHKGSLAECTLDCYSYAKDMVERAAQGLQWLEEATS